MRLVRILTALVVTLSACTTAGLVEGNQNTTSQNTISAANQNSESDDQPDDSADKPEDTEGMAETSIAVGSCSYVDEYFLNYYLGFSEALGPAATAILAGDRVALVKAIEQNPDELFLGSPLLTLAAAVGCQEFMSLLLDSGADPNYASPVDTPLGAATGSGNLAAVELLLKAGADVALQPTYEGVTALQAAAALDFDEALLLLMKAGARIDQTDVYGHTALTSAAAGNALTSTQILLEAGASVSLDEIQAAVSGGSTDFLSLIIEAGVFPDLSEADLESLLEQARAFGPVAIVDLLEGPK